MTDDSLVRRGRHDSLVDNDANSGLMFPDASNQKSNDNEDKFFEETLTCLVCFNLVTEP